MKRLNILVFILMIAGFMNSCSNNKAIETTESRKRCKIYVLNQEQITNLLYSQKLDSIQFIDIRNAHDYSISHLPNAVNVPLKDFLDKKHFSRIDKNKILMVYGYDSSTPRLISLLSAHYKLANFYVISGGYDFLKNNIIDNFGIYSGMYNGEKPMYDFAKKMAEVANSRGGAPAPAAKPKAAAAPVMKRKKKEVSGGCG